MLKTDSYYRYLPVMQRDLEWGLCVTGAGYRYVPPGGEYPPKSHVHPSGHEWRQGRGRTFHEYGIVYVPEGAGEFESTLSGRVNYSAGCALLLFPDVWHRYQPVEDTRHCEYWVTFHGDHGTQLQEHKFIDPARAVIETGIDNTIVRHFRDMIDCVRLETAGFGQVIAAATLQIIAVILAASRRGQIDSAKYELVRRCKVAIEEQTVATPVIEDLADALDVSSGHLRRVFKEHTGISPYQYHLALKIDRAKNMLRQSDAPIKQIAKLLGFENVYSFSKLFKQKTGIAPKRWRDAPDPAGISAANEPPSNQLSRPPRRGEAST